MKDLREIIGKQGVELGEYKVKLGFTSSKGQEKIGSIGMYFPIGKCTGKGRIEINLETPFNLVETDGQFAIRSGHEILVEITSPVKTECVTEGRFRVPIMTCTGKAIKNLTTGKNFDYSDTIIDLCKMIQQ